MAKLLADENGKLLIDATSGKVILTEDENPECNCCPCTCTPSPINCWKIKDYTDDFFTPCEELIGMVGGNVGPWDGRFVWHPGLINTLCQWNVGASVTIAGGTAGINGQLWLDTDACKWRMKVWGYDHSAGTIPATQVTIWEGEKSASPTPKGEYTRTGGCDTRETLTIVECGGVYDPDDDDDDDDDGIPNDTDPDPNDPDNPLPGGDGEGDGPGGSGGDPGSGGGDPGNPEYDSLRLKNCITGDLGGSVLKSLGLLGKTVLVDDQCWRVTALQANGGLSSVDEVYDTCPACIIENLWIRLKKCADDTYADYWVRVKDWLAAAKDGFKDSDVCYYIDAGADRKTKVQIEADHPGHTMLTEVDFAYDACEDCEVVCIKCGESAPCCFHEGMQVHVSWEASDVISGDSVCACLLAGRKFEADLDLVSHDSSKLVFKKGGGDPCDDAIDSFTCTIDGNPVTIKVALEAEFSCATKKWTVNLILSFVHESLGCITISYPWPTCFNPPGSSVNPVNDSTCCGATITTTYTGTHNGNPFESTVTATVEVIDGLKCCHDGEGNCVGGTADCETGDCEEAP